MPKKTIQTKVYDCEAKLEELLREQRQAKQAARQEKDLFDLIEGLDDYEIRDEMEGSILLDLIVIIKKLHEENQHLREELHSVQYKLDPMCE